MKARYRHEFIVLGVGQLVLEPKKVFRIYDVDGETMYLKYGAAYYKSVRRRFPVPDRRGLARRTGQLTMDN